MAIRYECRQCGAIRADVSPCRVCGSHQVRPINVRLEPRPKVGTGAREPRTPFRSRRES